MTALSKQSALSSKEYAAPRKSDNQIYMVDPRSLKVRSDVRQPLKKLTREDVDDLIQSYRERIERGLSPIRTALEVTRHPSGELVLITGRRRRRAAMYMGLTEVPIIYADTSRPLTQIEELEHEISENSIRKNLNVLDEARAILSLIALRGANINSFQNMIENAPEGTTPENVLVGYLKRLRSSLGRDEGAWKAEMIRNPMFKIVIDVMKKVGKDWYPYTERVLSFLSYRAPIQELFNHRIIGYESAKKLNKIRDDSILAHACDEIRATRKKNKGMSEKDIVVNATNNAFSESRALKKVSSVIRITERTDVEFTKIDPGVDKYGWYYNKVMLPDDYSPRKDMFNGAFWNTPEVNSDLSLPRSVYERLLHCHARMSERVLLVGQSNPEALKIALKRGLSAIHIAPDAISEYTYASPLDNLQASVYRDKGDRLPPKLTKHRIVDAMAHFGILTLHPYGEVDLADDLSWTNKNDEPTHMLITADYYALVGHAIREMSRTCRRYAIISRYSEKKRKGGRETENIYVPSLICTAVMPYVEKTYYFKGSNGKTWTVFIVHPPHM